MNDGRQYVIYTGFYGMHDFNFLMGGIDTPNHYKHHGTFPIKQKYLADYFIYLSLGEKSSNIKCKVRMYKEFSKIEVYYGTKLLFSANSFISVYKELAERGIEIKIYNKHTRQFENESLPRRNSKPTS